MAIRDAATQDTQQTDGEAETLEAPPLADSDHDETHDAETLRKIVFLNRNVAAAQAKYDRADRARKAAKEGLEEEQAILNEFIGGLDEELPLFDRKPEAEASPPEDWRSVRLDTLTDPDGDPLSETTLRALAENDPSLETLGAVADWSKGGKALADVKGIGEVRAELIQEVMDHYWTKHPVDGSGFDEATGDVNSEVLAGVKEAEAGPAGWRYAVVGDIGLEERTVELLDEHVITTVGELVAITRDGAAWLGVAAWRDIGNALERFRGGLTDAQIVDFDAVRRGEEGAVAEDQGDHEAPAPAPKAARPGRARKASA